MSWGYLPFLCGAVGGHFWNEMLVILVSRELVLWMAVSLVVLVLAVIGSDGSSMFIVCTLLRRLDLLRIFKILLWKLITRLKTQTMTKKTVGTRVSTRECPIYLPNKKRVRMIACIESWLCLISGVLSFSSLFVF